MMLTGRGGSKDHPGALVLFEKAAGHGHVGAMFAVGAMLGGGHDVPWDRVTAQRWFRTAAERGHPYAQMMLGRYLARGLAGEQNLDEARRWTERAVAQGLQEAKADLAALPPASGQVSTRDRASEEKSTRAAGD
jgi:TPR repeat protein